ncbi:type 1 glutamine amidotransferase domain-containing protein [Dokdonia sp. Hel_I_53]|uniref:type 1 glutamine amidotransferase domain-containing protein n=1 Tax=Dokdonia sp. Hel_I_53 TaxID=1566287 RepID=UPI00119B0C8F|nr:type 1 glutamine amidotransferase domain-containing protein [Dokdonia sp. Hel_I_53]TVZ51621.1 protease I [Dokdonia sp. Hel_I_53]
MNKRIAILATDGFEESELKSPKEAMENAGFTVDIISEKSGTIKGWADGNWSNEYTVTNTIDNVRADQYNALMLPGGVINPDKLRRNDDAILFIRDFFKQKKPVGAICHAPQLLIEADVVKGRELTSFNSIKTDLINAGAKWIDKEVVCDEAFVTSRNPNDLPAFNSKLIEEIREGKHELQHA